MTYPNNEHLRPITSFIANQGDDDDDSDDDDDNSDADDDDE